MLRIPPLAKVQEENALRRARKKAAAAEEAKMSAARAATASSSDIEDDEEEAADEGDEEVVEAQREESAQEQTEREMAERDLRRRRVIDEDYDGVPAHVVEPPSKLATENLAPVDEQAVMDILNSARELSTGHLMLRVPSPVPSLSNSLATYNSDTGPETPYREDDLSMDVTDRHSYLVDQPMLPRSKWSAVDTDMSVLPVSAHPPPIDDPRPEVLVPARVYPPAMSDHGREHMSPARVYSPPILDHGRENDAPAGNDSPSIDDRGPEHVTHPRSSSPPIGNCERDVGSYSPSTSNRGRASMAPPSYDDYSPRINHSVHALPSPRSDQVLHASRGHSPAIGISEPHPYIPSVNNAGPPYNPFLRAPLSPPSIHANVPIASHSIRASPAPPVLTIESPLANNFLRAPPSPPSMTVDLPPANNESRIPLSPPSMTVDPLLANIDSRAAYNNPFTQFASSHVQSPPDPARQHVAPLVSIPTDDTESRFVSPGVRASLAPSRSTIGEYVSEPTGSSSPSPSTNIAWAHVQNLVEQITAVAASQGFLAAILFRPRDVSGLSAPRQSAALQSSNWNNDAIANLHRQIVETAAIQGLDAVLSMIPSPSLQFSRENPLVIDLCTQMRRIFLSRGLQAQLSVMPRGQVPVLPLFSAPYSDADSARLQNLYEQITRLVLPHGHRLHVSVIQKVVPTFAPKVAPSILPAASGPPVGPLVLGTTQGQSEWWISFVNVSLSEVEKRPSPVQYAAPGSSVSSLSVDVCPGTPYDSETSLHHLSPEHAERGEEEILKSRLVRSIPSSSVYSFSQAPYVQILEWLADTTRKSGLSKRREKRDREKNDEEDDPDSDSASSKRRKDDEKKPSGHHLPLPEACSRHRRSRSCPAVPVAAQSISRQGFLFQ